MNDTEKPYITSCPACGKAEFENSDIILKTGPLMRCRQCGQLVFPGSEKAYHEAMAGFNHPMGTCQTGTISDRFRKRSRETIEHACRLLNIQAKTVRLLDVGCSSGSFLTVAKDMGISATGVEPMPGPAQTASEAGLDVRQGFLENLGLPDCSCNLISLFEVIEHLQAPATLLHECNRILEPGGIMVIRTGNADSWTVQFMQEDWDYFSPHIGHISFFNPVSMGLLAEKTGFQVEEIRFHSVNLFRRENTSPLTYRLGKFIAELLNLPSKLLGKSHEMEVYLRKS